MHQLIRIFGVALAFLALSWLLVTTIAGVGSGMYGEWKLVFQRWDVPVEFWGLALLCCGCVAAIAALFHYEQRLIPRPLGWTLLGLRVLLVLVLFLTLLAPVWTYSHDETRTGRVLLAVDVSQSMDTVDLQASDAEKIRWAEALGMLGNPEIRGRTRAWARALDEGREPEWVLPDEVSDPEKRARLARVRKENLQSQLKEVTQFSRLDIARRALIPPSQSMIEELKQRAQVQFAAFAETAKLLDEKQLENPHDVGQLGISRTHSNLAEPAEAARQSGSEAPLAGIVIISDGHDTDSPRAAQLVGRLQGLGVPVHTVLVGSEHRPRDLSIVHIDHPESVFLKDQSVVKSIVQTSGFEGQPIKVYLDALDEPDREREVKTVTPQGPSIEVAFTLPSMEVGRHRFRIRTDVAPNETRDDNNSRDFSISVVDDRAKVLLLDGDGRWEFRFLNDTLSRDERVSLDAVLFEQPFLGVLRKPFFPQNLEDVAPASGPGTPFATYDLVLIGDVSPQHLNAQRWQQLDRYVREEGGTLVLTAGKRFFPYAYQGTLADALIPLENLRQIRVNNADQTGPPDVRGFKLSISADGEQLPMFQLDTDALRARRIWSELPGHLWGIVGEARGGASVWAAALEPGQRPSLEQERKNSLIVQQYVGAGQVVWIGLDSTWRWRYLRGDLYHHRFWGQLVRWAVSFKAAAGNDAVRLGLRDAVIRTGQPAFIQARWDERFFAQHPGLKAQAIIERTGAGPRVSQTVDLVPHPGNELIHEGQAANLPAGEYMVRLKLINVGAQQELPETMLIVNEELTPELQDVSANRPLLEEIARQTGGEFLLVNELDRLPKLFENVTESESIREEIPLYSHWLILVLFSGIAMTEWVLRKLNGLP